MGTNYYVKTEQCKECGHKPEGIHLGKSSYGWQFSFQYNGGQYYKNVAEMKEWLKDKRIENEYNEDVTHEGFWKMVDDKQKDRGNLNHTEYCKEHHPDETHVLNIDGYSFTDAWFS